MIRDDKRSEQLAAIARKWCPDASLRCVSAIEEALAGIDDLAAQSSTAASKPIRRWVGDLCKTCGAYTHSCKCEPEFDRAALKDFLVAPPEGAASSCTESNCMRCITGAGEHTGIPLTFAQSHVEHNTALDELRSLEDWFANARYRADHPALLSLKAIRKALEATPSSTVPSDGVMSDKEIIARLRALSEISPDKLGTEQHRPWRVACKEGADRLESLLSATATRDWQKGEWSIVAWEIDQGQIGISVRWPNGDGSAWAVEPDEHVQALLKDGLRYRWLRGGTTDYTPIVEQALCLEAMDEWIDNQMAREATERKGSQQK